MQDTELPAGLDSTTDSVLAVLYSNQRPEISGLRHSIFHFHENSTRNRALYLNY